MKKQGLIIFLFLFSISGIIAQGSEHNQTDGHGRKQGFWKKYDEMGYVRYEGQFKDDIPVGAFSYFYPDGNIRAISKMSNDGKVSRTKLFHRNGKLMAEGKYFDQKKDSIWNYYSEYDGVLLSSENYIETQKQGVWKNFYPDGTVAEEITYANNVKSGSWKRFHTDLTTKLEGNYLKDLKEGNFTLFHPNGQLELSGTYEKGLQEGMWIQFDENGKKLKEENYKAGKLISENKF